MKKIKGFTLLELIIVITIIGIVGASLLSMKNNTGNKTDIGREAVNVIYKEMNQYIKDFQRNKVREDASGDEHEIQYFYIKFSDTPNIKTGNNLTVGNLFVSEDGTTGRFEGATLISGQKYSAFQVLKGSNNYTFYMINEDNRFVNTIGISNNGKVYDLYARNNIPQNPTMEIPDNLIPMQTNIYRFLICGGGNGNIQPIGIISINAVSKATNLERCENEKYAGIDCDSFATCN